MDVFPLPKVLPSNENKGPALVDTAWVFWIASTVVTVGRLYSKIVKLKRFALDDGLMLLAWVRLLIQNATFQSNLTLTRLAPLSTLRHSRLDITMAWDVTGNT